MNINISKKANLLDEISSAVFAELDNIDFLCFALSNSRFVLGGSEVVDTKQLNVEMLRLNGHLSNGGVLFTEKSSEL